MTEKTCAGIVLYNPDLIRLKENIESVSIQVDEVVLIDNNSKNKSELSLFLERYNSIHIIWNESNVGIAAALNQILKYAENNKYVWALLLDQDSIVTDGLIDKYSAFQSDKQVSIICPQIIDMNHAIMLKTGIEEIKCSTDTITSGSCIRVEDWAKLGGFDERLFIDFVDTDYQERCLRSGRIIIKINDAHLYHEVGSLVEKRFLGFKLLCSNHNPSRRYYMVRNRLFFRRQYFGRTGYYKELIRLLLGTFKIVLFEDQKAEKVRSFIKGVIDSKSLIEENKINTDRRKRVSIVLPSAFGTGGINVLYKYGRMLSNLDYKVKYYVPLIAYNMHRGKAFVDLSKQVYATIKMIAIYFLKHKIKQIRLDEQADIKLVPKITDKSLEDADAIIASAWMTAYDVNCLSKRKGEKYYYIQGYETWDNERLGKESYALPLKKIVIAQWIKDKLMSECGCNGDEITIINNGIDTRKFNNPNKNYSRNGMLNCLMLDHKLRIKGVKEGIEAFRKAKEIVPDISLTMFGMAKSSEVPDWVEYFQDPNPDVLIDLYRRADIFIFPSIEDGWGLTPIEAMACKCAVVGTRVGCMIDLGKDGVNVLLSDPGDVEKMANNLIELASNLELRIAISEEGYRTVQKLDWEEGTNLLVQTLGL